MTTATSDAAEAPVEDAAVSTPATTRQRFARISGRGYTVIRNIFVQAPDGDKYVGSSLGRLIQLRQPRALLAYLLLLMSWSALDKRPEPLEAAVWARALSPNPPSPAWPPSAMTRIWNVLEEQGLIERERRGRLVKLKPRREDAKRSYERPRPDQRKTKRERFFILPDAFWTDGWHERLTSAGVAALLILLSETTGREEVHIAYERAPHWYGISPKTLQNGLEDLRKHDLVKERRVWVREDFSKIGKTCNIYYSLDGAFSRPARAKLQAVAARETRKRIGAKPKPRKTKLARKNPTPPNTTSATASPTHAPKKPTPSTPARSRQRRTDAARSD